MDIDKTFSKFATGAARVTGSPWAFGACLALVAGWALSGPLFKFSETWQLVINTSTTIITFLMVFLIQNTQNRDGAAIQAKLDELILSSRAENQFIGIEQLSDKELAALRERCVTHAKAQEERHQRVLAETAARRAKRAKPAAKSPARKRARKTAAV